MEHGGHPPGEALDFPDAAEARGGIFVEKIAAAGFVEVLEGAGEDADVGDGEVQSLGAGGRDDVGGVTGEEEITALHGLDDEAAHRRNPLLGYGTFGEFPVAVGLKAGVEFLPDAAVGPILDVFFGIALDVETADGGRAHAEKGEAAV